MRDYTSYRTNEASYPGYPPPRETGHAKHRQDLYRRPLRHTARDRALRPAQPGDGAGHRSGPPRDVEDARAAIAAAKRAFPAFARTSKAERIALLHRLHEAVKARGEPCWKQSSRSMAPRLACRPGWTLPANVFLEGPDVGRLSLYAAHRHRRGDHGADGCGRPDHAVEQRCRLHLQQAGRRSPPAARRSSSRAR